MHIWSCPSCIRLRFRSRLWAETARVDPALESAKMQLIKRIYLHTQWAVRWVRGCSGPKWLRFPSAWWFAERVPIWTSMDGLVMGLLKLAKHWLKLDINFTNLCLYQVHNTLIGSYPIMKMFRALISWLSGQDLTSCDMPLWPCNIFSIFSPPYWPFKKNLLQLPHKFPGCLVLLSSSLNAKRLIKAQSS